MKANEIFRHVVGYLVGILLFFVLIPFVLFIIATRYNHYQFLCIVCNSARLAIAAICGAIGIVFVLWSNAALFFIGKGGPTDGLGIVISPRTKHLVITGPYRYTRNPMIFGALCCYIAWSVLLNSPLAIAIILLMIPVIIVYLKKTEEKRLLRDFGDEFIEYRKRVPIFFPKIAFKKKD